MDHQNPSSNRRLSEISHLFLSDVRNVQTGNAPRPVRKPPGSFWGDVSIDLTPEEFAQVFGDPTADRQTPPVQNSRFKPVRAVIAHHLGELMADRVRDLAGTLCAGSQRIGVIYADASDIRVCCMERAPAHAGQTDEVAIEPMQLARVEQTIVELNADVEQWLVVLPDPRQNEARHVLKLIRNWVLVTAVDHDGVVSSYRTIKGLCEGAQPALSVAIFGAVDGTELHKTHNKLSSVCEQFLKMKVGLLGAIEPGDDMTEHCVLHASANRPNSDANGRVQWDMLGDLAMQSADLDELPAAPAPVAAPMPIATPAPAPAPMKPVAHEPAVRETSSMKIEPAAPATMAFESSHTEARGPAMRFDDTLESVIDLPDADATPRSIIRAIVQGGTELVESPIRVPANEEAMIAVSRDHKLIMLAVARSGLSDLRAIAQAYRWMNENRQLIAMALPQFAIDQHARPQLRLIVDHADVTADVLQPLMSSDHISVTAYRKLRWGAKTGLLLEAA